MRSVSYVKCKLCGKPSDVHFAHGAIEVTPCTKCSRLKWKTLKRLCNILWWPIDKLGGL